MRTVSSRLVLVCTAAFVASAGTIASASIVFPPFLPLQGGDTTTEIKGEVTSVDITNGWGKVTVVAGDKHQIVEKQSANLTTPAASYTVKDGKLTITVECMGPEPVEAGLSVDGVLDLVNSCTDDLTVTVPANAPLTVHTAAAGDITTTGINAVQDLTAKQGDIAVAEAKASKLSAVSGSGNVKMSSVTAPTLFATSGYGYVAFKDCAASAIEGKSTQGAVSIDSCEFSTAKAFAERGTIQITDSVRPASIDARSTKGEVTVVVPRGAYALTTKASEQVFVGAIKIDRLSQSIIKAIADDGGVKVIGQQ